MKKKKLFIQNESKGHAIVLLTVALVVLIVVATLSLLPSRYPKIGDKEKNGVARSFLFPFVFTNEKKTLFLLKEDFETIEIDDNVQNVIHDIKKNKIYYLRDNVLCEYSIKKKIRQILSEDVTSYKLFENRTTILCLSSNGQTKMYSYSSNETKDMTNPQSVEINNYADVGTNYFLFLDNLNELKADLLICSLNGKSKKIASGINPAKSYGFTKGDRYVFYYVDNNLYFADKKGKVLTIYNDAQMPIDTIQPAMIEVNSRVIDTGVKNDIRYVICNILPGGGSGDLEYLNKTKANKVATGINRIIYYRADRNLIIFAKDEGTKVQIFKSSRGNKPELIIETTPGGKYIFDEKQGYLYINSQSGKLTRINIFDKKLKEVDVAEDATNIYSYRNKAIVLYENIETETQCYILENNNIEKVLANEKRLYGIRNDAYLFLRSVPNGSVSLDLVTGEGIRRITGDLQNNVFYDKNLDKVLYISGGTLLLWTENNVITIGKFEQIQAVTIAE